MAYGLKEPIANIYRVVTTTHGRARERVGASTIRDRVPVEKGQQTKAKPTERETGGRTGHAGEQDTPEAASQPLLRRQLAKHTRAHTNDTPANGPLSMDSSTQMPTEMTRQVTT